MSDPRRIVAVAAHAADMEFSAGATLLKHALTGWEAHIIQLTLGEKGHPTLSPEEYGAQKRREAEAACEALRVTPHFLPYADGELAASDEVAREIAALFRRLQPEVIIAHWRSSIHADHIAAHHLARRAFFMAANPHFDLGPDLPRARWARMVYADNWEDAEGFLPYIYVDVSEAMEDWQRAFECFAIGRGEGGYPYWDWYDARTRLHGIRIGARHAQAFAVEDAQKLQVR
ncbi:MAG: PIG-L family deacetylase, partial [Armatimonadetes bacterium]|nr:PIG-L family deacetylase [Armatimonadota bacterium]